MTDEQRQTVKRVRLTEPTHARLKDHCREGETLSGAVDRALDALEREVILYDALSRPDDFETENLRDLISERRADDIEDLRDGQNA